VAAGIIETASATFLLLIAVRWFEAGSLSKGLVAAGSGLGYLVTPLVVSKVEAMRIPVSRAASQLALAGAVAIGLAAVAPVLVVFVPASVVAMAAAGAMIPLLTQMYQDNYPEQTRGRFFSRTVMIRIVSAAGFAFAAGHLLSQNIGHFRALLVLFAAALLFSSWCLARIPTQPLHVSGGSHPFRALRYARDDEMFQRTLVSWMLMGFANLMMLPLRVEYLANPRYALAMRPDMIALLTGVVPNLARLVLSPIWGWLFDRANFFVLRMSVNIGFALGIASFFTSDSTPGLVLAAIVFGVSVAGGDVAWSLWVTKIAPPERVADYMSVHTFFTGVRGLIAPLVGFALVAHWSMTAIGWLSAALILAATLYLLPEVKRGRLIRRRVTPATPPVPADEGRP
jgi:MFS family permease